MTGPTELAGAPRQPWAAHGRTGSGPALAAAPRGKQPQRPPPKAAARRLTTDLAANQQGLVLYGI
jgi:hypothetical protein